MSSNDQLREIEASLFEWGKFVALDFRRVGAYEDADLEFSFERGEHGDGFNFSGSGEDIAHAFAPFSTEFPRARVHFDADEMWTDRHPGNLLFVRFGGSGVNRN